MRVLLTFKNRDKSTTFVSLAAKKCFVSPVEIVFSDVKTFSIDYATLEGVKSFKILGANTLTGKRLQKVEIRD